ncbi:hypothetical protein SeLEV6574_g06398 [Synchytrium endobioticum]|uniref:Ran-binding-domain-containing protein n=1 Tax=Synchytrium endobioticum TaxID=286115 RepID=A0A507CNU5_9FUNG|nr:hypothetical protein SeLEV6574_g06398 [Synchytrium endobioticum]
METLLASLALNGISTFSKTAFSYASQYAVRQLGGQIERMLKDSGKDTDGTFSNKTASKIRKYKSQIEAKMAIVTPSIELAELMVLRGNSILLPVVEQAKEIVASIEHINVDKSKEDDICVFLEITLTDLKDLIHDLNLSFTMCQINAQQSWSRLSASSLIRASQALTQRSSLNPQGDDVSIFSSSRMVYYSLFEASVRVSNSWTWKEEFALANVQVMAKVSNANPYQVSISESFDDDRVHEGSPRCKTILLRSIASLFFAPTGQLLNIPELSSPVLVLKMGPMADHNLTDTPVSRSEIDDDEESVGEHDDLIDGGASDDVTDTGLGVLECILRLCMAEVREGRPVAALPDEILSVYLSGETNNDAPLHHTQSPRRSIKSPQSDATPLPGSYSTSSTSPDLHSVSPRHTPKGVRSMSDRFASLSFGHTGHTRRSS